LRDDFHVTGTLVQAYTVCPRQVWLASRQICPDEDNVHLALGRLIDQQSYGREKKEIRLGHLCLDLIRRGKKQLVIGEVKKSSRAREAARLQLAFYLHELAAIGIEAEGELLFPEERRKERVILDKAMSEQIKAVKAAITALVNEEHPPQPPNKNRRCSTCAYAELCWA
jgi:CRISPR-associated exonuclease Cas4